MYIGSSSDDDIGVGTLLTFKKSDVKSVIHIESSEDEEDHWEITTHAEPESPYHLYEVIEVSDDTEFSDFEGNKYLR